MLSRCPVCNCRYSLCMPFLSRGFPGQYCIVKLAIAGLGILVTDDLNRQWPGVRRADGLVRRRDRRSLLSGLLSLDDREYREP